MQLGKNTAVLFHAHQSKQKDKTTQHTIQGARRMNQDLVAVSRKSGF